MVHQDSLFISNGRIYRVHDLLRSCSKHIWCPESQPPSLHLILAWLEWIMQCKLRSVSAVDYTESLLPAPLLSWTSWTFLGPSACTGEEKGTILANEQKLMDKHSCFLTLMHTNLRGILCASQDNSVGLSPVVHSDSLKHHPCDSIVMQLEKYFRIYF